MDGCGGAAAYIHRLESFMASSLRHELYELDATPEGESRTEDLLCRIRELCEMGGVRSFPFAHLTSSACLRRGFAGTRRGTRALLG